MRGVISEVYFSNPQTFSRLQTEILHELTCPILQATPPFKLKLFFMKPEQAIFNTVNSRLFEPSLVRNSWLFEVRLLPLG